MNLMNFVSLKQKIHNLNGKYLTKNGRKNKTPQTYFIRKHMTFASTRNKPQK